MSHSANDMITDQILDADLFTLRFTNVTCGRDGEVYHHIETAIQRGRDTGFEFSVFNGERRVASWTTFGGLRRVG